MSQSYVSYSYGDHLKIIRILSEASGALEALAMCKGTPLTDSQVEAIARLRTQVQALLDAMTTVKGAP